MILSLLPLYLHFISIHFDVKQALASSEQPLDLLRKKPEKRISLMEQRRNRITLVMHFGGLWCHINIPVRAV